MNDPFIAIDEIKNELKEIEDLGINLARNLSLLSQKIKYIISRIKTCETLESADNYFNLLDIIISTLNLLVYKEEIGISDRLSKFMHNFDNIHENKEYYFKKIKSKEYSF
jgi:hypothetical protein